MTSAEMNILKSQFLGQEDDNDLIDYFSMFLKNVSNMMQGIFHYTSTILHASHLLIVARNIQTIVKKRLNENYKEGSFYSQTSTMCTSDDACRMTSIIFWYKTEAQRMKIQSCMVDVANCTSAFLKASYPRMNAKVSDEKSTMRNLNGIMEMNSQWYTKNTLQFVLLKTSKAVATHKYSQSCTDRQLMDHNLLSEMLSQGATTECVSEHEICCLVMHYECLGSHTMLRIELEGAIALMLRNPSPMSYFYILSHPIISTTLGFRFTKYYNLKMMPEMRRTENWFRNNLYAEGEMGDIEIFVSLLFGEAKKYKDFIRKNELVSKKIEAIDFYTKDFLNPQVGYIPAIFRSPESPSEVYNSVILKCFTPGVIKTFSFDTSSKMYASGVYVLKTACLSVRTKKLDGSSEKYKCSLTKLLTDCDRQSLDADFEDFKKFFPQHLTYESIMLKMMNAQPDNYDRRNSRKIRSINFNRSDLMFECSLIESIKTAWYNVKNKFVKKAVALSCFSKYMKMIDWLRDSALESWRVYKSMYGDVNVLDFYNNLSMYEVKDQIIKVLHRGPDKSNSNSMLCSFLSYSYSNRNRLILQGVVKGRSSQTATFDKTIIKVLGSSPYGMGEKIMCVLSTTNSLMENCVTQQDKLLSTLSLANGFLDGRSSKLLSDYERDIIFDRIRDTKQPAAYWINPQQVKQGKFTSDGVLMITISSLKVYYHIRNNYLVKVTTNSEKMLRSNKTEIVKLTSHHLKGIIADTRKPPAMRYDLGTAEVGFINGVPFSTVDGLEYDPKVTLKLSFNTEKARFELKVITFRDTMHNILSHDIVNYYPSTEDGDLIAGIGEKISSTIECEIDNDLARERVILRELRLSKADSKRISEQMKVIDNFLTLKVTEPKINHCWLTDTVIDEKIFAMHFAIRKKEEDFLSWFDKSLVKTLQLTSQYPKSCFYSVELIRTAEQEAPQMQYFEDCDFDDIFNFQLVNADVDISDMIPEGFSTTDYATSMSEMDETTSSIGLLSAVGSRVKARNLNLQTSSRFYDSVIKNNILKFRIDTPLCNWKSIPLQMQDSKDELVKHISELFRSRGLPKEPRVNDKREEDPEVREVIDMDSLLESGTGGNLIDIQGLINLLEDEDGRILCESSCKLFIRKISSILDIAFNTSDLKRQTFDVMLTHDDYTVVYNAAESDSAVLSFAERLILLSKKGERSLTDKTKRIITTLIELHSWDFDDVKSYSMNFVTSYEIISERLSALISSMTD